MSSKALDANCWALRRSHIYFHLNCRAHPQTSSVRGRAALATCGRAEFQHLPEISAAAKNDVSKVPLIDAACEKARRLLYVALTRVCKKRIIDELSICVLGKTMDY